MALNAAKTVLEAVDIVMKGDCKRVFCAIRPPGHHIGVFGAVEYFNKSTSISSNDQ